MKKRLMLVFVLLFIPIVFAISSANYQVSTSSVISGGNASSSSYSMGVVLENIAGSISSSSYNQLLGFFFSFCGDGTCNSGETCSGCVADCTCSSGYTCTSGTCVADAVATTVDAGTGGGGGGGAGAAPQPDFSIDESSFNVNIVVEDLKTREFKIKNLWNKTYNVEVTVEGLENFILIEDNILMEPLEERTIEFKIASPDEIGVFPGKIILKSSRTRREILVAVNTQSKETLFDLSVAVLEEILERKDNLRAQLTLLPVGEKGVDVSIKYLIKDFKGKVYYENSETFYVDGQMSYVKEFKIDNLDVEDYVLGVEMVYVGGFATASSQFKVVEEKFLPGIKLGNKTILLFVAGVILILIIIITLRRKQTYKKYGKIIHSKKN